MNYTPPLAIVKTGRAQENKASWRAKAIGAQSLKSVADFYGFSTNHLNNIFRRNPVSFDAMVVGYLEVTSDFNTRKDSGLENLTKTG